METSDDDIQRLVHASAGGDTESFHRLYTHMIDRVYAYLRSRTGSKEEATDIAQDVFVELWKALPRFTYHSREQFYAYVFIITKRKLYRLYKEKYKETEPFDEETIFDDGGEDTTGMSDAVRHALTSLDPTTREILVLHHWSRYTFGEIAALINMNESAVRVRHHRALTSLRALLRDERYA